MTENFSFLSVLQSHADQRGDFLVHLLPDRDITYRRLWSRIERASARLQGEWNVQPGDVVAYRGNAHPDAIVLYFALLRIGALLLPLEGMQDSAALHWLQQAGARLLVHEDGHALDQVFAQPLSMLLADWCHFDPMLAKEDPALPALLLPLAGSVDLQAVSLQQLTLAIPTPLTTSLPTSLSTSLTTSLSTSLTTEPEVAVVDKIIFSPDTLSHIILPALLAAQPLTFTAVEAKPGEGHRQVSASIGK